MVWDIVGAGVGVDVDVDVAVAMAGVVDSTCQDGQSRADGAWAACWGSKVHVGSRSHVTCSYVTCIRGGMVGRAPRFQSELRTYIA